MAFDKIISRPGAGTGTMPSDRFTVVPEQVVNEVVQLATQSSALMQRAKQIRMSSKTYTQPVLSSLPEAQFINGEPTEPLAATGQDKRGLKPTTSIKWEPLTMTAEEIAVIAPIPDALVDDASIPLWEQVRPLIAEAVAKKLDEAAIFGIGAPASWDKTLLSANVADTVDASQFTDYAAAVAEAGRRLGVQGLGMTGFISEPGLQWKLATARDNVGQPLYVPSINQGAPGTLYGLPLNETNNGAWLNGASNQRIIAADWSKVYLGVRQDVTFKLFDQGVISDDQGNVLLNLMQNDAKALRCVFRVGFTVAQPISRKLDKNGSPIKVKPVVSINGDPKAQVTNVTGSVNTAAKA
ncbi:phage major capsid protein [Nocardia transvalensis]|uniref:phage major capsid protein n=1 Tax=Nocardia transvalensis TaxID=37333 RepID=UPI0018941141|nr:phage major capsid protein [Nocardia transvalensis]MBF6330858.1 phage major capsid protein [Nocardia transvalensis]